MIFRTRTYACNPEIVINVICSRDMDDYYTVVDIVSHRTNFMLTLWNMNETSTSLAFSIHSMQAQRMPKITDNKQCTKAEFL